MSGIGGVYYYHPSGSIRRRVWTGCEEIVTPVLVLDPENREKCGELVLAFREALGWQNGPLDPSDTYVAAMQAALRSLLDPKPEEPKSLGAVVVATFRDDEGKGFGPATWVLAGDGSWVCLTDGIVGHSVSWPFLSDVEVLSHGVPEDGAR
jgi:hypothetical protein